MKKGLIVFLLLILILGAGYVFWQYGGGKNLLTKNGGSMLSPQSAANLSKPDIKNTTYRVEGISVGFVDGQAVKDPAYPSVEGLELLDGEAYGDLDNDGDLDAAVALRNKTKQGEELYYASVVINESDGKTSSPNATLLGDKIAPKQITIKNNEAVYDYDDHTPNTSTDTTPSVPTTIVIVYDDSNNTTNTDGPTIDTGDGTDETINVVASLNSHTWKWEYSTDANNTKTYPSSGGSFTLSFSGLDSFNAVAECNVIGGQYDASTQSLIFNQISGTNFYCPRANEAEFWKIFQNAKSYSFNQSNELVFSFGAGNGSAVFK